VNISAIYSPIGLQANIDRLLQASTQSEEQESGHG
jgi:hypothetical protein